MLGDVRERRPDLAEYGQPIVVVHGLRHTEQLGKMAMRLKVLIQPMAHVGNAVARRRSDLCIERGKPLFRLLLDVIDEGRG